MGPTSNIPGILNLIEKYARKPSLKVLRLLVIIPASGKEFQIFWGQKGEEKGK